MNLFFYLAWSDTTFELLNLLIKKYNPEKAYVSCHGQFIEKFSKLYPEFYICNNQKSYEADYTDSVFENECPPIDSNLLKLMSIYEPIIMNMFDRQTTAIGRPLTYDERVRRYHLHLRYWNYILDSINIKIAIFVTLPHSIYNYIIYCLCRIKGIAIAFSYFVPGLYWYGYFSNNIDNQGNEIINRYNELLVEYENTPISEIELPSDFMHFFEVQSSKLSYEKTPDYVKNFKSPTMVQKVINNINIESFDKISKIVPMLKSISYKTLNYIFNNRKIITEYNKLSSHVDLSKRYIYLPLHYQPEVTSSPIGSYYANQLLIARMLSFWLPNDIFVYIKEHPAQTASCRSITFYRDLAGIPNVILVNRKTDSYKLIENCLAVASISGTAGLEAMFMGKPFLIFGYYINMYAPGAFHIQNNEDCKHAIDYILKHGAKHTLKDMKLYLKALSDISSCCMSEFSLLSDFKYNEEDCINLYNGLIKEIDKHINY